MPEYSFVVHNKNEAPIHMTHSFPDLEAARHEAIRALTDLAREDLPNDGDSQKISIDVSDGSGRELLVVSLEFAVTRRQE